MLMKVLSNKDNFVLFVCTVLLFVFLFIFFYQPVETDDVWTHLSISRWMFQSKQFPEKQIFPYSSYQKPWIHTQWLGGIVYYLIYSVGDLVALKVFRALFFVLIVFIFFCRAYRNIPLSLLLLFCIIIAYGLRLRCFLRPFVFNFLFIEVFLICLFDHRLNYKIRKIWLIPFLSIIWSNIHIGSFVYGTLLIIFFLLWDALEYVYLCINHKQKDQSISKRLRNILLVLVGHLAAFFVNPYGITGGVYPYKVFFTSQVINKNIIFNYTAEMLPPAFLSSFQQGWWLFSLVGIVVLCIYKKKKYTLAYLVLFIVSIFSLLHSVRTAGFFVLCSAFIVDEVAKEFSIREKWKKKFSKFILERYACCILILVFLCNIVYLINLRAVYSDKTIKNIFIEKGVYNPEDVVSLLKENGIAGGVLNSDLYGGYLLWKGYPELRPMVDGRHIDQDIWLDFLKFRFAPHKHYDDFISRHPFDIVLSNPRIGSQRMCNFFKQHPDWQLIAVKSRCVVFVRRGMFKLPEELGKYENKLAEIKVSDEDIYDAYERLPFVNLINFGAIFNPEPFYVQELEEGVVLSMMGYEEAGLGSIIRATKKSPYYGLRNYLSVAHYNMKNKGR